MHKKIQKLSEACIKRIRKIQQVLDFVEALGLASGEALGLEGFAKSAFFAPGFAPSSAHFCSPSKLIGITSAVLEIPKLPNITPTYSRDEEI